ncbi:MAG: phosphatidate cytidylyltransferase [Pseudomonadota bacterium]
MTEPDIGPRIFNQELKLRVISALVMAALVLWITWIGGMTFVLLWAVLAIAILFEYTRICKAVLSGIMIGAEYAALFLVISAWISGSQSLAFWIAGTSAAVFLIWELVNRHTAWMCLGFVYSVLPFFAMSELRGGELLGFLLIIMLFACVWGADIFAYFFGKGFGGPKLAPRISPKKTWSGFVGGLLGAVGLTYVVTKIAGYEYTILLTGLVLFLAIASQIGDLLESVLKRVFDVKDSGTIIPGHGGVLDRIDGLIIAGVLLWAILTFMAFQDSSDKNLGILFESAFLAP